MEKRLLSDKFIAKRSYTLAYIKYLIMDQLKTRKPKNIFDLKDRVFKCPNWDLYVGVPLAFFDIALYELLALNLVRQDNEDKKIFYITDKGFEMLQGQVFQNLFTSSFLGYQSYKLSRLTIIISLGAFIVSFIALVVSINN